MFTTSENTGKEVIWATRHDLGFKGCIPFSPEVEKTFPYHPYFLESPSFV